MLTILKQAPLSARIGLVIIMINLVAIVLAFNTTWRSRGTLLVLATVLFFAYHLLCRIGESLMQANLIGARLAALLPVGIMAGILFVLYLYPLVCARLSTRY